MVFVDVDGTEYPCHRFLPSISGKISPIDTVNVHSHWEPDKCKNCKIVSSCPTCAGFNWEINNNTGIRTTFHCEAHKLEVLASAKLAVLELEKIKIEDLSDCNNDVKKKVKKRINAILELVENGI
jgi:radical SAM protein with 4Fe4S-binding SPASM domain